MGISPARHTCHSLGSAVVAAQHEDRIEGRRHLGLDVAARSRISPANGQNTHEATGPTTPPALTA